VTLLLFIAGLAALVTGAELLVRGASKLALSFGISPLVVGLTIVAFGTSAPEMAVSVGAVLDGKTDIAVGNVVGSNIFNVLFILGLSALITPLVVNVQLIRQEVPIMIGASLLLLVLALDGRIGVAEGAFLFVLLLAYTGFLVLQSRAETQAAQRRVRRRVQAGRARRLGLASAGATAADRRRPRPAGAGLRLAGHAAVAFAKTLGVSDVVIGLTIVAAGTSMPEVAASVTARSRASATSRWATWWAAAPSTSSAASGCPAWCPAAPAW
jgi:cation:H+ antiporter